jgi:hypothetical protein
MIIFIYKKSFRTFSCQEYFISLHCKSSKQIHTMKYYNKNIFKGGLLNLNESMEEQIKKIDAPEIRLTNQAHLQSEFDKWHDVFEKELSGDAKAVLKEFGLILRVKMRVTVGDLLDHDLEGQALTALKDLVKNGRARELPIFWTDKEFEESLKKPRPIDYYVYDLGTKEGREATAKKFLPLCKKQALSLAFKNAGHSTHNIAESDLYGAAMEGLTFALYNYGRSRDEYVRTSNVKWIADEEKEYDIVYKGNLVTFISWSVRMKILDYLNDEDKLVRVPRSENARVRQATGANVTQSNASGDETVYGDEDERSKFDTMSGDASSSSGTDQEDTKTIEQEIFKIVKNKFGEEALKLWQEKYGLGGVEPRDKKKNPYGPNDYYRLKTIEKFVKTNPEILKLLKDLYND